MLHGLPPEVAKPPNMSMGGGGTMGRILERLANSAKGNGLQLPSLMLTLVLLSQAAPVDSAWLGINVSGQRTGSSCGRRWSTQSLMKQCCVVLQACPHRNSLWPSFRVSSRSSMVDIVPRRIPLGLQQLTRDIKKACNNCKYAGPSRCIVAGVV